MLHYYHIDFQANSLLNEIPKFEKKKQKKALKSNFKIKSKWNWIPIDHGLPLPLEIKN